MKWFYPSVANHVERKPSTARVYMYSLFVRHRIVCYSVLAMATADETFDRFRYVFNNFIAEQLRLLFETKHLYQKLSIAPDEIYTTLIQAMPAVPAFKEDFANRVRQFTGAKFTVADRPLTATGKPIPCLVVGNVKLFCSKCDTREAFRPIWFSEITNEILQQTKSSGELKFKMAFGATFQLFYVVYQCQRCEGKPEVR
jgi:hypothetical protein